MSFRIGSKIIGNRFFMKIRRALDIHGFLREIKNINIFLFTEKIGEIVITFSTSLELVVENSN